MLRHYGELGLLIPDGTDVFIGYTYYSADQLAKLGMIKYLQNMGFGLSTIKDILDRQYDPNEMKKCFKDFMYKKKDK